MAKFVTKAIIAKIGTNADCITYGPNFKPMQVAFYLADEITQVLDAVPWVRCASGNVIIDDHNVQFHVIVWKDRTCQLSSDAVPAMHLHNQTQQIHICICCV